VVHQMHPEGYVSEDNAKWLLDQIGSDGKVDHINELELLIRVMEQSRTVPDSLSAYALEQVKKAVISGTGALRSGKQLEAGIVDEADVELLRRILYAYASEGNISITTAEAELLFDINDATTGKNNHPAWADLFAKALANHLMFYNGHATVDRKEALRRDAWVSNTSINPLDFIGAMVASLRSIYGVITNTETAAQKARREAYASKIASGERLTASECEWLTDRIGRDGKMSDAEKAALSYLKQEAIEIDPMLQPLLDKVA
jgi:hypothetical protein